MPIDKKGCNKKILEQKSFIVEGNIGAGKSTFLSLIKKNLSVQVVYEPLEKWQNVGGGNLFEKFYQDTARWAYTFQSYAFITRVIEQQEKAKINQHGFQVLERSVYSDRYCFAKNCFEMGTISALEWRLYQEWFEWLVVNYTQKPTGFIYLRTDPKICYERLNKRNRLEEESVPLSYLESLHQKHEDWLLYGKGLAAYLKNTPVLVLDCNKDFENDPIELNRHIASIASFMGMVPTIETKIGATRTSL